MSRSAQATGASPDTPAKIGRVLLIPGLDGDLRLLARAARLLFPELRVLPFRHAHDAAVGGVDGLAERALAVLDADRDGTEPAYVCGESFGGTIALTLARRHPERVRGLILLSAFGWYPVRSPRIGRLVLGAWQLVGDEIARVLFRLWRPISVPGALGFRPPPDLVRLYLRRPDIDLTAYRAKWAVSLGFDARPWLHEIACPTLVMIGTWDPVVPIAAGRLLADRIPRARLVCLPGGHLAHVVRAGEAGALTRRWLAERVDADRSQGSASLSPP